MWPEKFQHPRFCPKSVKTPKNKKLFLQAIRSIRTKCFSDLVLKIGISVVFKKLTGRSIRKEELRLLEELQFQEYKKFKSNKYKSKGWIWEEFVAPFL